METTLRVAIKKKKKKKAPKMHQTENHFYLQVCSPSLYVTFVCCSDLFALYKLNHTILNLFSLICISQLFL